MFSKVTKRSSVFLVLACLSLSGCLLLDEQIPVDVKSFYAGQVGALQPGKTYAVAPMRPQLAGSLEFQSYAQELGTALHRLGFVPEHDLNQQPDVFVLFDYEQLAPDITLESVQESYAERKYTHQPSPWPEPYLRQEVRTIKRYPKIIRVDIVDGRAWAAGNSLKFYEGTAETTACGTDLGRAIPIMISALFQGGYPSTGGMKRTITVVQSESGRHILQSY